MNIKLLQVTVLAAPAVSTAFGDEADQGLIGTPGFNEGNTE